MGHKNYSKFSKRFKKEENETVTNVNSEQLQSQTIVSNDETVAINTQQNDETIHTSGFIKRLDSEMVTGFLTGCKKLYVRKWPSKDAEPLYILDESSEFMIDIVESPNEDFCKVYTASGIDGYCMKKFICVK